MEAGSSGRDGGRFPFSHRFGRRDGTEAKRQSPCCRNGRGTETFAVGTHMAFRFQGEDGMRKPNPDPHPERSDIMDDISPEKIVWRQIDRYLESQWKHDEGGIHGSISGLSALMPSFKDDTFEAKAAKILRDVNGFEERNLALFEEIIRLRSEERRVGKE